MDDGPENLNVTVVLINNHAYAILRLELMRTGAGTGGPKAQQLLDLANPDMDFAKVADGFRVPSSVATTCEELAEQFSAAVAAPGPHLIDARIPPLL